MTNLEFKELRAKLGLTQVEMAKLIGVDVKTVQNWETGRNIPKTKHGILHDVAAKNHIVLGSQTSILGDNVNGDNITEVRKLEVEEEEISSLPAKGSCDNERLFALLEQKQKSLDDLIAQQSRYLAIIETLTNKIQ